MLSQEFWDAERKSSLLNRSGVKSLEELEALRQKVRELVTGEAGEQLFAANVVNSVTELFRTCTLWITSAVADQATEDTVNLFEVTPENERIFRLDAERTFATEQYRETFCNTLKKVFEHIGDYHQGEGFVIAFLSLFLETEEVVTLLTQLHKKHMHGYFSCTPEAYVRDCRVLMKLLKERHEKLHDHIEGLVVPETFCSKWFIAMNIHVLTFEHVITYMKHVFTKGHAYIFRFGLAFLLFHADELVACGDVSKILQILRIDEAVYPDENKREEVYQGILKLADETEVDGDKITEFRKEVEEDMKKQKEDREKRLKEIDYSDEEIVFSDEEDKKEKEEPVAEAKPEVVPEPQPEPVPEPVAAPEPEPQPEPAPEPEAEPEPEPEPQPEPAPEPEAEPEPEPQQETVPEPPVEEEPPVEAPVNETEEAVEEEVPPAEAEVAPADEEPAAKEEE
ncbi:hypothetical protein BgAZ_108590 [Babesia gibsoni]|uniref:Rab-GAP TBC domain-containing protein n=1 Tax=Babesia gibsoni TaxID=33632 RepID=A0AAD8PGA4_BABGI|nr:hypothetical protein BgAZ_108590 [Babesia gibsoni]